MNIAELHGYIVGWASILSWVVVMILALILRVVASDKDNGWFWSVVSFAQILLAIQAVFGVVMMLMGRMPGPTAYDNVFHALYGFGFPLATLIAGHKIARDGPLHPLTAFATVGLVNFGLTARALQVAVEGMG